MNQKGFANINLVVVVIILLGAVGYFVFVKKTEPAVEQSTSAVTPTTTTPIPKDETFNWKTYNNGVYGFEFKYPDGLVFVSVIPRNECWYGKEIVRLQGISGRLCVAFDSSINNPASLKFPEDIFGKITPQNISIDSKRGYLYSFAEGVTGQRLAAIQLNGGLFVINFTQGSQEVSGPSLDFFENDYLLMNQILSTFKFTK